MAKRRPFVVLTGDRQLDKALRTLEDKLQKKIVRSAVRKAAKPVLEKAKALVPVRTGALRKSLKIRAMKRSRRRTSIGVQVVTGQEFFKGDTYYGGFLEFGTKRMAARPFMRPAADAMREHVKLVFRKELRAGILKEVAKLKTDKPA